MISFEEFKEILREEVAGIVDGEVTIVTVPKNNNVQLDALSVKCKSSNISPVIYIAGYYDEYIKGRSIESIVSTIIALCKRESGINEDIINDFSNFEKIKDYIQLKLVNKDNNSILLNRAPYLELLDLAIICSINVPLTEAGGEGSVIVLNQHMDMWGVDKEKLFDTASKNSLEKCPALIRGMNEVIKDMYINNVLGEQEEDELCAMIDSVDSFMYVLTNEKKHNGAITMTYENVIRDFANEKNSNIYILPSSIHEVLLVPAEDDMRVEQLREMVQSVNQSELEEVERLSDNVYYYDRETHKLTIA